MSYAFDRSDASLEDSLRRIVGEELSSALDRLAAVPAPDAVHGVRKNLKKTRALLRLVRDGLPEQSAANAVLRDVAGALSGQRDAAVRLATFDRLFGDPPAALCALRTRLHEESQSPSAQSDPALHRTLSRLREQVMGWHLAGKDRRILQSGLARTRQRAQQAAQVARADTGQPERIHDWRKRVKDLWYQTRLFVPVWPDLFRPLAAGADRLGEALGDHHDLSVLAGHAATLPPRIIAAPALRQLDAEVRNAQTRIEAEILPLSDRLLAGDPKEMAGLWLDWHAIWRLQG